MLEESKDIDILEVPSKIKFFEKLDRIKREFDFVSDKRSASRLRRMTFKENMRALNSYVFWIDRLCEDNLQNAVRKERLRREGKWVETPDISDYLIPSLKKPKSSGVDRAVQTDASEKIPDVDLNHNVISKDAIDHRVDYVESTLELPPIDRYSEEENAVLMIIRQKLDYWEKVYEIEKNRVGKESEC